MNTFVVSSWLGTGDSSPTLGILSKSLSPASETPERSHLQDVTATEK